MSIPELLFAILADTSQAEGALGGLADAAGGVGEGLQERLGSASEEMEGLSKGATGTRRAMSGLAAAVRLVNPEMAGLISTTGALATGLGALGVAMGPAIAIAGGLTLAISAYSSSVEAAEAAQKQAEQETQDFTDALGRQADAAQKVEDRLRALRGEVDRAGAANAEVSSSLRQASDAAVAEYDKQIRASEDRIAQLEEEKRSSVEAGQLQRQEVNRLNSLTLARDQLISTTDEQIRSLADEAAARFELNREAERERKRAEREAEDKRNAAEAARLRAAATREEEAAARALARAQAEVDQIRADSSADLLTDEERINAVYDERLIRLSEIMDTQEGVLGVVEAAAAVERAREDELYALNVRRQRERMKFEEALAAQRERADKEEEARILRIRQAHAASIDDIGTSFRNLSGIAEQIAEERSEADRRAAQRALRVSKGLAKAEATASFASGIVRALALTVGRPAARAFNIAALTTGYAQQLAAIQGVSLHQGGTAPDEVQRGGATLLRDERVLSPAASRRLGAEGARQLERGEPMTQIVPFPVYQHFGRFFPGYVQGNASALSARIERGRTTGRRSY